MCSLEIFKAENFTDFNYLVGRQTIRRRYAFSCRQPGIIKCRFQDGFLSCREITCFHRPTVTVRSCWLTRIKLECEECDDELLLVVVVVVVVVENASSGSEIEIFTFIPGTFTLAPMVLLVVVVCVITPSCITPPSFLP
jgi:hypothetical protein